MKAFVSNLFTGLATFSITFLSTSVAFAGPVCTKEPKNKWQSQDTFRQNLLSQQYKIKAFKITTGNCYLINGSNKEGQKVEVYFNPVTGKKIIEKNL